jgi:hypothetical protein
LTSFNMSKFVVIGGLIGLGIGMIVPLIFPSLLDIELRFCEARPDIDCAYSTSTKRALPGSLWMLVGLFAGSFVGFVIYLLRKLILLFLHKLHLVLGVVKENIKRIK